MTTKSQTIRDPISVVVDSVQEADLNNTGQYAATLVLVPLAISNFLLFVLGVGAECRMRGGEMLPTLAADW